MHNRLLALLALLLVACAAPQPAATPTPAGPPPQITAVTPDTISPGHYERLELAVALTATYDNPFDSLDVALSADFSAPSGVTWSVPGFWDGRDTWRVRFTPSETGAWRYIVRIRDRFGAAASQEGAFEVTPSQRHGWLQLASWRDPNLSSRYLVHHDGTPFYGVGHCDAFTLGDARVDAEGNLNLLKRMAANGENLVVWWPHYTFTFFRDSVKTFDRTDMLLIDSYLESADRLGIVMMYTIWDHNLLRGAGHPWGAGRWETNGFRTITPEAADFFTSEESWRWQENFYRYIIARWGYSPSIIWMTVSELNGTSGGANQDRWHARVNDYFVRNDPYRHPTTASLSGDQWWEAGFAVTDIPQVHLYDAQKDPLAMGDSVAEWTSRMWRAQQRPNVVGEFGTTNRRIDLPLLHNSIWAGLMSGAAITPLRWSDRGSWGRMNDELMAQMGHLARFVDGIPFAALQLQPVRPEAAGANLAAYALANNTYALVWAQDREPGVERAGVQVTLTGMADGTYTVLPYNTWQGAELPEFTVEASNGRLIVDLPPFAKDIALKITLPPRVAGSAP